MLLHTKITTLFTVFLLVFALSFPTPVLAGVESNNEDPNVSELSKSDQDSVPDQSKEPISKEDSPNDEEASANEEAKNANDVDLTEKDSFSDSKNSSSDVEKDTYRRLTDKEEINKDLVEATPNDSTAPKPEVSSVGNGTVTLTWEPISGATKYAIAEYVNGKYKTFTTKCTETTYTISNLSNGKTHYFLVQANVDGKWSSSSPSMVVEATPHGIIAPQVEAIAGDRSVRLNWESVPGATKYAVAVKQGSGFKTYTLNCTALTYHISGLTSGVKYYFVVQAFVDGEWSNFSSMDYASATPYGPKLTKEQETMFNKANNSGYSSYTNYLILVDLSDHKVGVFKGKKNNWNLYYYWNCVTGKASTPTIKGKYSTTGFKRKTLTTDSRARWCTQIWGGYFFHSILASNDELGKSLSHGCIRLPLTAAKWMYDNIKVGTTVVIYK